MGRIKVNRTFDETISLIQEKLNEGKNFTLFTRGMIKGKVLEEVIEKTKFLNMIYEGKEIAPSQRVWCILNNITREEDIPKCKICNEKYVLMPEVGVGFKEICSQKCAIILSKQNLTPEKKIEANKKRKETVKTKYGVGHVSQLKKVKEKKIETAIKNYGSLKAAYFDTMKETVKEKYNVENISQLESVKMKKIETSRKNYGTDYPWQSEIGRQEQKQGVIDKYGVDNVSKVPEIQKKKEETFMKHYGVNNIFATEEFKFNNKLYWIIKYGVGNPSDLDFIKEKKIETCQGHWGVDWPGQADHVKEILRIKGIERANNSFNNRPTYNPLACKIIDEYGKINGYNFQHAENGGEYHIKDLNVYLDGYDTDKNIVIEIDEPVHYDSLGNLKQKDIERQNKIQEYLNCVFIRIKVKEYEKQII